MMMRARIQEAIDELLDIEHVNFGSRIGLLNSATRALDPDLVKEIVYSIDELAWSSAADDQKRAVQLMGIAWDAASPVLRRDLREFLSSVLVELACRLRP